MELPGRSMEVREIVQPDVAAQSGGGGGAGCERTISGACSMCRVRYRPNRVLSPSEPSRKKYTVLLWWPRSGAKLGATLGQIVPTCQ